MMMGIRVRVHAICAAMVLLFAFVCAGSAGAGDTETAAEWFETGGPPPEGSNIRMSECLIASCL